MMKLYDAAYVPVTGTADFWWNALFLVIGVAVVAGVILLILRKRKKAKKKDE